MKTYLTIIQNSICQQIRFMNSIWARSIFLCFMILVFNQFWSILQTTKTASIVVDTRSFLSYLMVGAILQFSKPEGMHKQIEDDLRTGSVAYQLVRPINIVLFYCCQIFGVYLIRIPLFFLIGTLMIYITTGAFLPINPVYLPIVLGLMFFSACFATLCLVFIGLSTLYLYDSLPFFWLIQKCEYVLGGLFFPIIFYPEWLYKVCLLTPFGWSGYKVASLLYNFSAQEALSVFLHLLAYNVCVLLALLGLFKLIIRRINVYG